MHKKGDNMALHAACTHIEDRLVPLGTYQTDGIFSAMKASPKTPGEAAKPGLLARLKSSPKPPGQAAKPGLLARLKPSLKPPGEAAKPSLFTRLRSATKSKPKVQWDVNREYLNLTKTYSSAQNYHFGDERTPRYGILFDTTGCKYFRDEDTACRDDNSYVSIRCKVCPNNINTRLYFHTNGKPTNFAEWKERILTTEEEFTQIQWIRNPTEYFSSKNKLQQPKLPAEKHEAAEEVVSTQATNPVNPYLVAL